MTKQKENTEKETWRDVYKSDHITAADFDDTSDTHVLLVNAWKEEVTSEGGRKDMCIVGKFKGYDRPAVLNVTACKQIQAFTGTKHYEDWKNVPLSIFVTETKHRGDVVPCWRIRPKQPNLTKKKPDLTPDHDKWSDAVENLSNDSVTIEVIRKHFNLTEEYEKILLEEAGIPEFIAETA